MYQYIERYRAREGLRRGRDDALYRHLPAVLFKSIDMLVSLLLSVKSVNVLVNTSPESIANMISFHHLFFVTFAYHLSPHYLLGGKVQIYIDL